MIAVDTNVLVRIVVNDHPAQVKRAAKAMRENQVFVSKTVLLEMEWVLRYTYNLSRVEILQGMRGILGLPNVTAEDEPNVAEALNLFEAGFDFGDALHVASRVGAAEFVTFDQGLCRKAKRIKSLAVVSL